MALTDGLVAAWGFNKDLGEGAGEYKDGIGGLVLTANDGLDHPAASPKLGAGAYQGANALARRLQTTIDVDASGGYTIAIWWRAASLTSVTDEISRIGDFPFLLLQYNRSVTVQ